MKTKLISTLGILFLLLTLLPSAQVTPALAQTCTDPATGAPIPCPTEAPPTGGGGGETENGSDTSSGGSNPTKPKLLFLGNNENYLDPANWNNGGRIPGSDDSARLDGLTAVIDPRDPTPIPLGDLTLRNGAHLIVRDAALQFDTLDSEGSTLEFFNSYIKVNIFIDPGGFGGFNLNPSFLEAERIVLYKPETPVRFGLGGDQPASAGGRGPGHYARMQGNSIELDGQLNLFFVYGFRPQPGNTFEIITNTGGNPINGFFANAPEGAVINGFCDIQFRITYVGGDGNDVVLTTETPTQPDPNCSEDFTNPRPDGNVLLDASSIDLEPDQPIEVQDIQLVNNAEWNLYNGIVTARIIDSNNSAINLFNSHLKTGIFIDPGGWGGFSLNPSFLEAERIVLYKPETPARFGLGGDQPASAGGRGPGHYARMQGNSIELDGQLNLFFVYGFRPQPGNTFEIITNTGGNPINGFFANAPEGAVINGFCDIQFRITYKGGDGNDVVLTAEALTQPDPSCNVDFSDPRPDGNVLLDASSIDLEPDQPIEVQDIQLVNNAEWNLYNGIVTARIIDSTNSAINLFNSHLKTGIFIDPGGWGGFNLNPSFLEAERIVIHESETKIAFGIGGTEPAGANALGQGHYAHMQGNRIRLDGKLEIFFVYDFVPEPGQTFQIITVNRARLGEFENAPEGAVVGGYCDVELVISYLGGDGNDVVLTAQKSSNPNPEWECGSTSEPQPEPAQESNTPAKLTPYLIGGAVLVLVILLAVFLRKRPA